MYELWTVLGILLPYSRYISSVDAGTMKFENLRIPTKGGEGSMARSLDSPLLITPVILWMSLYLNLKCVRCIQVCGHNIYIRGRQWGGGGGGG